ncbi:helix-turn-helix protein [Scopulibacillus darangshiensis]|uniref:Helix-turn-helix protein n=1 Tax=Scopulibacillus darangshiensis TaxID=442528 RepID=A0A4R2N5P6_9BACL|nr:helix-turn-helix domain-containing protein [Scopulibacillus darangshiensis]TCP16200.1 helix-turn-helix protein [Scopulibacillus darangshiensis]
MDRRNPRKYPYDLKKQVVEMYLEGHPLNELVEKFDLGNVRRVYEWAKRVREGGYKALNDQRGLKSKGKRRKNGETPEEEIERLKLENQYLKKLLDLKRG